MKPGTKEICRALVNSRQQNSESGKYSNTQVEVKLDSCGSVSIGHSSLLTDIKSCREYKVPTVILKGIGGKTEPLTKVGILKHVLPNKHIVKWLCYVCWEIRQHGCRQTRENKLEIKKCEMREEGENSNVFSLHL